MLEVVFFTPNVNLYFKYNVATAYIIKKKRMYVCMYVCMYVAMLKLPATETWKGRR